MRYDEFRGVYPALLTPFDGQNRVDFPALRALVRHNLAKGVHGFYVCGSTAEAFLLSPEERKAILEAVAQEVNGRAKIIAHVGEIGLDHALDLARHAAKNGADAISSIPPFYYGFSMPEIKSYYFALADAADVPVLIYNFPGNSGVKLTLQDIGEFLRDPRFLGLKHTSSDYYLLERVKALRADAVVFNGYDEMFVSGMAMGADGGIGSTYNFMAEKFLDIYRLVGEGKLPEARRLQREANNIIEVLLKIGVIPGAKLALTLMGLPMGPCRRPFAMPDAAGEELLKRALRENGCAGA